MTQRLRDSEMYRLRISALKKKIPGNTIHEKNRINNIVQIKAKVKEAKKYSEIVRAKTTKKTFNAKEEITKNA